MAGAGADIGTGDEPPRRRSPRRRRASGDEARLLEARADERTARARLAELEFQLKSGELLPRKVVDDHDAAVGSFIRRWMLGLSKDWPPRLVGLCEPEMRSVIDRMARDVLTRMAKMDP